MPRKLRHEFYTATSLECRSEIDSGIYKPAVAFEVRNRITGIACYYNFPRGMSSSEYERRLVTRTYDERRRDWGVLKRLNPDLKKIRVDTGNRFLLHDAIIGVSCLFNVDDINFFVRTAKAHAGWVASSVKTQPKYRALYNLVKEKAADRKVDWVPATATLTRISKKLDAAAASGPT